VALAAKVGMRFERTYTDEYGLCHIHSMELGPPAEAVTAMLPTP
jgi:hypothetical protein